MYLKNMNNILLLFLLTLTLRVQFTMGMLEGLYCGKDNCYDVLGVTRDSSKSEISKAYRKLAKIHHPDKHRTPEEKSDAEQMFTLIATAYEILKDEESRTDYDYMLDNPDEYYRNYYRYYRRRMAPNVDVRLVIGVSISVISIFQYYTAYFRWSSGVKYLATQQKYRTMALQVADEEGLLDNVKKMKKRNKDEIKSEEERIIRLVLESKMDIRGGYAKPKVKDVLWIQIIFLPVTFWHYICWYFVWIWKFWIKKQDYGEEEKLYLIRKYMRLSETQFEAIPEEEKSDFLESDLWIKDNFIEWKKEKDETLKRQWAESARYKSYRRYLKKHGTGRMYFDDS